MMNALSTQPHCFGERPKSSWMRGPATEMQMRSRYVITDKSASRPNTMWRFFNEFAKCQI